MTAVKADKRALRAAAAARRDAAHAAAPGAAEAAAERLDAALADLPPGATVSGYLAFRSELDPAPALARLAARGAALCMPVVEAKGRPLVFRRWRPGAPTVMGVFGVEIPADETTATPDVVIAPMLAFDRAGFRLGYGGGFYDRTLAALRAAGTVRAIGFAYAGQEVAAVPREPTDARLDMIVTERERIPCG